MSSQRHHSRSRKDQPWRLLPREQRRILRKPRAAREARERKAELPWERARAEFREVVAGGGLPAGCIRVVDALAEGHGELGKKAQQEGVYSPVYKAFGNRGDAYRTRVAAPTDLPALAEACGMSRRWVIVCISRMAAAGVAGFKKVPGGMHPDGDPRNLREKDARATKAGVRRRVEMAVGGAGWANGYLVEGIPDPPPTPSEPSPEPEPPPAAEPEPEAPAGLRPAGWWKSSLGPDPRPHGRGRGP